MDPRYEAFLDAVRRRLGGRDADPERAAGAVLVTLAEALGPEESAAVAAQLPPGLKGLLHAERDGWEPFGPDEFVRRVGDRGEFTEEDATAAARAVLGALAGVLSGGRLAAVLDRLPRGYEDLVVDAAEPPGRRRL
jgi:uncharacterized protein (DUF2267 family)